jgi:acyl carrier protein
MVPSAIIIVADMPLTANGKVNRQGLNAPALSDWQMVAYEAPATETEQLLAQIWAHVLELPIEQLSIHDNFFTLGGHSLSALTVIANINQKLSVEISIKSFFETPTITELNQVISQLQQTQSSVETLDEDDIDNMSEDELNKLLADLENM